MKKEYIVRLANTSYEDDCDRLIVVNTDKSLSDFEQAYNKIRDAWFEEESPDCLMDYLEDNLSKLGFEISSFNFDTVLDF